MNFSYFVRATKDFKFSPTFLDIYIGPKELLEDNTEVVNIQTVLTETLANGTIVETKNHKLPVSVLQQAIAGFRIGEKGPDIDRSKLAEIIAPFHLELTPE